MISIDDPDLLRATEAGIYCARGDFFIDPLQPVRRAVLTHAHGDHARGGSQSYLCTPESLPLLRQRLGEGASIQVVPYGQEIDIFGVKLSLHPAGHILGSAQVRIEHAGRVWVVTGDYKRAPDPTCQPFQPLPCHVLITESTFGLPVFRWPESQKVIRAIADWWKGNAAEGKASVLFAYATGKAQRVLTELYRIRAGADGLRREDSVTAEVLTGPIYAHGTIVQKCVAYREAGVSLPPVANPMEAKGPGAFRNALVLAPPSAMGSPWLRRFGNGSTAMASGWMCIRGMRRRRALDQGFVLSDHADWTDLLQTIEESGAERVYASHGSTGPLVRFLREKGLDAHALGIPEPRAGDAEVMDA